MKKVRKKEVRKERQVRRKREERKERVLNVKNSAVFQVKTLNQSTMKHMHSNYLHLIVTKT